MAGGVDDVNLEYTPTWIVALVCAVIVAISLAVERILHFLGKYLLKKRQKPLFEALQKIKEELMLLGFISLLLTVCQDRITEICIPKHLANDWLPCKKEAGEAKSTAHLFTSVLPGGRHLLAGASAVAANSCEDQGKAQLLSLTALHHLHIFIFGLAASHVVFSALTILFGGIKVRQWKYWEDAIRKKNYNEEAMTKVTHVHEHKFIKDRFLGIGKCVTLLGWLVSFFKQFYGSVTESDYTTLRRGFVMMHFKGNPEFNFHKYIVRAFEADFRKVVGISWYLWIFVVIFLLLNVNGWHAYFWLAFVPFILLLAVGTKLEHVITQLAEEVAQRHVVVPGELVVNPSDEHFWFRRPQVVLMLIHIILFQNSFELAFFIWLWAQYGFDSCIMGEVGYIIPRLVIGVFVQFVCSYSTLPLYAIVTLMGSKVKKSIFEEPIQESLDNWVQQARQNRAMRKAANGFTEVGPRESSLTMVQLDGGSNKESAVEEGKAGEMEAADLSRT